MRFRNKRRHARPSRQHRAKGHKVVFYLDDPEYELLRGQSSDSGLPLNDCAMLLFVQQLFAVESYARMNEEKYGERFPDPEKCGHACPEAPPL